MVDSMGRATVIWPILLQYIYINSTIMLGWEVKVNMEMRLLAMMEDYKRDDDYDEKERRR